MNNTVEEMKKHSLVMKILYKAVEAVIARRLKGKKGDREAEFRMMMASSVGAPCAVCRSPPACGTA